METMWKHCDELTNKVANLEAVGTTPTKAPKNKSSIFNMSKKDASTSCNDLYLDSPLCNQVYVEKVVVDTCTQEVAMENEQLVTTRVFGEAKNTNFLKFFLQRVKHVIARSNTSPTR